MTFGSNSPRARPEAGQWDSVADRVQRMTETVMSIPAVRSERVAMLKLAIREGRYLVSSEQLAEAILNDLLRPAVLPPVA